MNGITKKQRDIIAYIQEYIATNRYSPSYREIGSHFGFSSLGSVYKHIHSLKKKGLLQLKTMSSRSLQPVVSKNDNSYEVKLPLIGNISAGSPIQLFPKTQEVFVPASFVKDIDKTYVLKVTGNSLNEELIAEGDLIILEAKSEANSGDTVVALINQHDTILKKYYPDGDYVKLTGCIPHQHPIILRLEDIQIQGIVRGLIRLYQQ